MTEGVYGTSESPALFLLFLIPLISVFGGAAILLKFCPPRAGGPPTARPWAVVLVLVAHSLCLGAVFLMASFLQHEGTDDLIMPLAALAALAVVTPMVRTGLRSTWPRAATAAAGLFVLAWLSFVLAVTPLGRP